MSCLSFSLPSPLHSTAHHTAQHCIHSHANILKTDTHTPYVVSFLSFSLLLPFFSFSHCSALPVLNPLLRCLSILFSPLFLSCAVRHPSTIGPILPVLLYSCRVFPPALLFCLLLSSLFSHFSALPALHLLLSCFLSLSHHPYCLVLSYFCTVFFLCWRALLVGRSVRCLGVGGVLCRW